MNFAIIAAGEGSRLAAQGISTPKPLLDLGGRPMVKRLIDLMLAAGAQSISIITNARMPQVRTYLESLDLSIPLNILSATTAGSMESFGLLSRVLPEGKFCLTTVDTIFQEHDFKAYIKAFAADDNADGYMGVTTYIDDEKPLYVDVDASGDITAYRDSSNGADRYISAGVYALNTATALPVLHECLSNGTTRMRDFQRGLLKAHLKLKAYDLGRVYDVDRPEDLQKVLDIDSTKA